MDLQRRRAIQSRSSDREAADGLLSGTLGPQDAPAEWRPVTELLTVLRTLPATTPQGDDPTADRDHRTVQAMAAILAEAPAHKAWRRHLRVPFRPSVPRPLNVFRVRWATGLVAASLLSTRLGESAPGVRRGLAAVYVSSAAWTLVAVARYLFWDTVVLGSLM